MSIKEQLTMRKSEMIAQLQKWIQCGSVFDPSTVSQEAPFGLGVAKALDYIAQLARKDGFQVDTCDGYATEITFGEGDEIVMVLGHADVVPVGKGWRYDPFSATIEEDKIYGRGSSDDKGPTFAAYYAMKLIKESNRPLRRKIRMVVGGNEESGSRCMDYYFDKLKKIK